MCESYKMTKEQKKAALACRCSPKSKARLLLYSCCGSVNVLCSACQAAGPRVPDYPGKETRVGSSRYYSSMDERKADSPMRRKAVKKWNALREVEAI